MNASGKNPPHPAARPAGDPQSALFTGLVLQQTQMAMMFLGQIPHPEKGEPIKDLEGASLFIDTLEMLQAKTKGNLGPQEEALLKQSLMSARMAFVEASRESGAPSAPGTQQPASPPAKEPESGEVPGASDAPPTAAPSDDEARKKFVKKY